jgi:hypothetical protein
MLRRGPGIARVAVGTAVMAGTAGAVRHHQDQKYAQQDYEKQQAYEQQQMQAQQQQMAAQQQQMAAMQAQQAAMPQPAPAPVAPAGVSMDEKMAQLEKLGQLHNSGILTDEEFAAQKAAILNG